MQPTCSLADEQIEKMWYIYTMEHYSATKKNEIMPFAATWTGLVSEVSQTKTNIIWYHSHRKLVLKIIKMNLFAKQKQTSRFWKQMYGYQRGNVCGGNKLEAWGSYTYFTIYKTDNQWGPTILLYRTGNSMQYSLTT